MENSFDYVFLLKDTQQRTTKTRRRVTVKKAITIKYFNKFFVVVAVAFCLWGDERINSITAVY